MVTEAMQKVYCPYCPGNADSSEGVEMILHSNAKIFYFCPECGARSPEGKAPADATFEDRWKAEGAVKKKAMQRFSAPLKPLTWWEALQDDAYLEIKGEKHVNMALLQGAFSTTGRIAPCDNAVYTTHAQDELKLYGVDYGKTWRCWSRRPNAPERANAKWEDAADVKTPLEEIRGKQEAKAEPLAPMQKEHEHFATFAAIGTLENDLTFSHKTKFERIYNGTLLVERISGVVDKIPLLIPEHVIYATNPKAGQRLYVSGMVRSYARYIDGASHSQVKVWALYINHSSESADMNEVELSGTLHKKPAYRVTSKGREVCDMILKVERDRGEIDLIPCIAFYGAAKKLSYSIAGAKARFKGRFQSREYTRISDTGASVPCVTYEIATNSFDVEE